MTPETDNRFRELCEWITKERDRLIFLDLVMELNQRLEEKDEKRDRGAKLVSNQRDSRLRDLFISLSSGQPYPFQISLSGKIEHASKQVQTPQHASSPSTTNIPRA